MTSVFKKVGLVGKANHPDTTTTLIGVCQFLQQQGCQVYVEQKVGHDVELDNVEQLTLLELGQICDLAIVIGGDGNMLGAARVLSRFDTAVIGINRGNLGFLTDINPEAFESALTQVLKGNFSIEERFLLEVTVHRHGEVKSVNSAVNEAVLHSDKVAHMIEFEVYINDKFVFSQRADGLIMSTPTGSTAYSLSGGGPILTPNLNAICLLPMFPHSLTNRPLVVDANSTIQLVVPNRSQAQLGVTCDGHVTLPVLPGDEIRIQKHPDLLKLLHPKDYNYFNVLRRKLNWGSKLY
ncbi:NAD(+) kinase [Catenovulum agarivorans DS-2]|uniref:NAD kinase n=1 Tax=Catenovulum agarivorans DS-2 TaxID=1328313 RepID=W7QGW4_9ALTE|nr:NAD(+) kinase [Catenovulum agarivorans]EWH12184.1 NAD(+) kinase [Catenovulum agarivorans DS-2]